MPVRDVIDRAVVLAEPDRAVGVDLAVGEVALLVLDDGELADPLDERRVRPADALVIRSRTRSPIWRRRASKTSLDQVVAADRADRREQPGRQPVVVRREEVLGVGGDVVQVARPADAVADRLAADEVGGLERAELLEDARSGWRRARPRAGPARSARRVGAASRMSRRRARTVRPTARAGDADAVRSARRRSVAALDGASARASPEG